MKIFQSPDFAREFNKLMRPKYVGIYGTLQKEIAQFFLENNDFEKVWVQNYPLAEHANIRINKVRLENSSQNTGKSGGFRLLIICDKKDRSVGLLFVFPKTGPHGKNNIDLNFQKSLVKNYKAAKDAHELLDFQVN